MLKVLSIICAVLLLAVLCDSYKILVVFPLPGKSHSILGFGIVKHLLKAGHEVTYITPFAEEFTNPNLSQIIVNDTMDFTTQNLFSLKSILNNEISMDLDLMASAMQDIHVKAVQHENVQKLMTDPETKFDAVIAEWLLTEVGALYAVVFDAPLIWVSTTDQHSMILRLIDEHLNPAYNIGIISNSALPLTFVQRIQELLLQTFLIYYQSFYGDVQQKEAYSRVIVPILLKKGRQPPTFDEVRYNASLVLGNAHVSMGEATRLPQNYKPIGGYHIEENVKPLPEDIKKLMDSAKDGVIYFSMGSNLKSKDWPDQIKSGLLKVFGELKQEVIWKFEEDFPNVPKNVHILKWAPQSGILSHPNCILFITHGGLLSTTEAIHFGVPIIGIPVFGDQFANVKRAISKGFAKMVDLSYNLADDLKVVIQDVVTNPKYRNKVKVLSLIYHDRPVRPGVELVHWVEHVVKTGGAPHLRSPALMVPWYQKLYLDLAAVVLVILFVVVKVLKALFRLLFSKRTDVYKKKN